MISFLFAYVFGKCPAALLLFCGCPHIFQRITRPDGMGEHPPNIRFSLHLVNLSAAANTAFAPAKRCMALSFAIGILCLLSMPQIGNIIAHYRICVNRLNVTAAAIRNRRRKIMICLSNTQKPLIFQGFTPVFHSNLICLPLFLPLRAKTRATFYSPPTTLSSSLAEVRFASLVE